MRYADALAVFREAGPFSVPELAARAGVSRPTLYRLLSGAVPRADDLEELALATGWRLEIDLGVVSEPLAAVAARSLLGDESVMPWDADAQAWKERLNRFVGARSDAGYDLALIDEAGHASAPAKRPGARKLRGEHWKVDRLVSAGQASEHLWALSGWAALDALGLDTHAPTIVWTEDAHTMEQLLLDSFRPVRQGDADLIILPAHPSVFAGAITIADVELVSPLQAFIDSVGLGGDARDRVLSRIEETS